MKKTIQILTLSLLLSSTLGLTSCGEKKTKLDTPSNITYDVSTGKFSFSAVEGAKTYTVGVSEIINDTTGKGLEGISGSAKLKIGENEKYVWTTQIGSVTSLADTDNDGKVEGTVVYRSFSASASNPGSVITAKEIPVGDFVLTVMADNTTDLQGSDYAYYEFSNTGALPDPESFTSSFKDDGKMTITAADKYYINALSTNGLAEKMQFKVYQDGELFDTIDMDDFSYTNRVVGPEKSYIFNNASVTTSKAVDKTKKITATVQAIGNGGSKQDSKVCDVAVETTTDAVTYATKYDCSGSGSADNKTVTINVGIDNDGNNIYGLEVKTGSVVTARESGTFTLPEGVEITELDGKKTYPEDTELTFTTAASDLDASVMNGKTLKVTKIESNGWGGKTISYGLLGEGFTLNGTEFSFTSAASSGGGMGGGPGGPF